MAASAATIAGVPGRVFRISFSGELAYEIAVPASHALTAWSALLQAGKPFGIRPYGLDALNTLRIEKGHVTSAELNGNTTADDLGFAAHAEKAGRLHRPRAVATCRPRGRRIGCSWSACGPSTARTRLRNGTQLLAPGAAADSLGYVTSSTPSVELEGWVGLALLRGGRQRLGQRLIGASPVHDETTEIEIVSPHMLDPENVRVRA